MSGRFDLRPLAQGVGAGLRLRRPWGSEPPDKKTRAVLAVVPAAVLLTVLGFGLALPKADQLLAGTALLIGGLLASFSQLAGWRERLLARERTVDGRRIRALDEAAAHILFSVVVSVAATADLVALANLDVGAKTAPWLVLVARTLGAIGAAAFTYLALTMVLVVNLLWDAYQEEGRPTKGSESTDATEQITG